LQSNQEAGNTTAENAKGKGDQPGRPYIFFATFALLYVRVFATCANFPVTLSHSNTGNHSRQGAKHAKLRRER
jgi:hypothetical protein